MAIKHLITTIIIFISIERIQSWHHLIPGLFLKYKFDKNDIDYFPWTVLFGKHLEILDHSEDSEYEFYYGSLIHPQAVFIGTTTQLQLDNGEYSAIGGCNFIKFGLDIQKCQTRKVGDVIVGKYNNNNNNGISDSNKKFKYVNIVILNQPFKLNDRIKPIRLAESNDMIDMNNCFFSSLKNVFTLREYREPLIGSYKVDKLTNGSMSLHISENRRIVDNKNREEEIMYAIRYPILLLISGSPVVCQDRFDTEKYLQIGYIGVKVITMKKVGLVIEYVTFLDIVPVKNEIRRKLNSYFNPNDHTLSLWDPYIWNLKINSSNRSIY